MDKLYVVTNPKAYIGYYIVKANAETDAVAKVIARVATTYDTHGHTEWYEDVKATEVIFMGSICDEWSCIE